ncbi:hypothetical protein [Clostridium estertheticum]|nr:hypothetical protein [Clostridium estertheticum]MCB2355204.1 hypothetical protein [Clostridium estertheticum]WAG39492.1 hypothetical protein LL065_14420 [Clostridium estertheticum]
MATRQASGVLINRLAKIVPNIIAIANGIYLHGGLKVFVSTLGLILH